MCQMFYVLLFHGEMCQFSTSKAGNRGDRGRLLNVVGSSVVVVEPMVPKKLHKQVPETAER